MTFLVWTFCAKTFDPPVIKSLGKTVVDVSRKTRIGAPDSSGIDLIKLDFMKKTAVVRLPEFLFRRTFVERITSLGTHILPLFLCFWFIMMKP